MSNNQKSTLKKQKIHSVLICNTGSHIQHSGPEGGISANSKRASPYFWQFLVLALLPMQVGPHFQFLGPVGSPFSISGFRTGEKSLQSLYNVNSIEMMAQALCTKWWHTSVNIFHKKTSLFLRVTSFRSHLQIYAFWFPISAVEGPHWVLISLKIESPFKIF